MRFLPKYPVIKVELIVEQGLTDIVSEHFDAGVRFAPLSALGTRDADNRHDFASSIALAPPGHETRSSKMVASPMSAVELRCRHFL